jgi:hypothetical protein
VRYLLERALADDDIQGTLVGAQCRRRSRRGR